MPNWCENVLVVGHADQKMLRRFVRGYKSGNLGQEFVPMPPEFEEGEKWYDWRIMNWGTKWDFGQGDYGRPPVRRDSKVEVRFDTAWSPPLGFYFELRRLGFEIDASFYEPGVGVCGRVIGDEVRSFGIDCWDPACIRRFVDRDLVEGFSIDDGSMLDEEDTCEHGDEPWCELSNLEETVAKHRDVWAKVQGVFADSRAGGRDRDAGG